VTAPHDHDDRPIALIGLTGAGKSAVARELGERLGTVVADLDEMIEAEEGLTVAGLFARSGEAWFRRREGEILDQALAAGAGVIACGGGIVTDPARREALRRRCRVVWLEVPVEEAARRIEAEVASRPLLAGRDPRAVLEDLLARRGALYAETAAVRIDTAGRTAREVADAVERELKRAS
jgi:shikimate kinase